jgi:hypothetical protein
MCYMPAYMPNLYYVKFYVFAYISCCIYYSTRISMPVDMLSSVYLLICQVLYPICYVIYAGCHMSRLICQLVYIECHVLVVISSQSDQLYAYFSTSFHMLYVRSHMPVTVYLHLYAGT